jgi:hypothetical protein
MVVLRFALVLYAIKPLPPCQIVKLIPLAGNLLNNDNKTEIR